MKIEKLIEMNDPHTLTCDAANCGFIFETPERDVANLHKYIGTPCPKCGANLLTKEDHISYMTLLKVVNFINKWFSWITLFGIGKNRSTVECKVHEGVHIKKVEDGTGR